MTVTTANITIQVAVDWDKDSSFATAGDDISAYVKRVDAQRGFTNPLDAREHVAAAGFCELVLNNADKRFSPGYAAGPLYNKLLPGKPVRVQATDGVTTWPVWKGFTADISPQAGEHGDQECTIRCVDALSRLQAFQFSLPLIEQEHAEGLIKLIAAAALDGEARIIRLFFTSNPANTNYFEFTYTDPGGTVNTRRYTFKTALATAGDVLIGATTAVTAANFVAAINNDVGAGTLYGNSTVRGNWLNAGDGVTVAGAGGTVTQAIGGSYAPVNVYDGGPFLMTGKEGRFSQITVTLGANTGSPTGDITWRVVQVEELLPGIWSEVSGGQVQTGAFTPTPSAVNTITVTSGIFMGTGEYYKLSLTDPGQDGSNYYTWEYRDPQNTPVYSLTTTAVSYVALTANAKGAWANAITTAHTGTWEYEADAPAGADATIPADLDAGTQQFTYAGDRWRGDVDALTALNDVAICEGMGFIWIDNGGTLVFKNKDWFFKLYVAATALTLNNEQFDLLSGVAFDDIKNDIAVIYTPRGDTTSGTLIRARGPIQVPGVWGTARWAGSKLPVINPTGGSLIVKFPAQDDNGNTLGIKSLVLPPVAGTNYTVNENSDGSGFNYTTKNHIGISVVINGGDAECSFTNDALGPLYVRNFYLEGVGLIMYDPQQAIYADEDSVAAYGRRSLSIYLPIPSEHSLVNELAGFLLRQRKDPINRVRRVSLSADRVYGGVNPHVLDIGDVISIAEAQTGIAAQKHVFMGEEYRWVKGQGGVILIDVLRVPDSVYGIYGTSTYGNAVYAL